MTQWFTDGHDTDESTTLSVVLASDGTGMLVADHEPSASVSITPNAPPLDFVARPTATQDVGVAHDTPSNSTSVDPAAAAGTGALSAVHDPFESISIRPWVALSLPS